jgi:hypothetical protein
MTKFGGRFGHPGRVHFASYIGKKARRPPIHCELNKQRQSLVGFAKGFFVAAICQPGMGGLGVQFRRPAGVLGDFHFDRNPGKDFRRPASLAGV